MTSRNLQPQFISFQCHRALHRSSCPAGSPSPLLRPPLLLHPPQLGLPLCRRTSAGSRRSCWRGKEKRGREEEWAEREVEQVVVSITMRTAPFMSCLTCACIGGAYFPQGHFKAFTQPSPPLASAAGRPPEATAAAPTSSILRCLHVCSNAPHAHRTLVHLPTSHGSNKNSSEAAAEVMYSIHFHLEH
jgi:hypothetical protein